MIDNQLAGIIEEQQYDFLVEAIRGVGGEVAETPELTWIPTQSCWPKPRGVFRTKFSASDADERIAWVRSQIQGGAIPNLWMTGPVSEPDDLTERLERHGFAQLFEATGMALKYSNLCSDFPWPDGLAVRRVEDDAHFIQWARGVTLWLFGMPEEEGAQVRAVLGNLWSKERLTCFVGEIGNRVVATSAVYVSRNVPGIYQIAVSPEYRCRGIGAQMTLAALSEGAKVGTPYAILQATNSGIGIYSKIGFREYCRLGRYGCRLEA